MERQRIKLTTMHLPALNITVGYAGLTTGGCEIKVGANLSGYADVATLIPQMIMWQFKCLKCSYKFTAEEPRKLLDAYNRCLMCGSKDFMKKEISR